MVNEKRETIEKFKCDFSREIFDKASKSFLKKNLIIPLNIKDECLYVITSENSNSDEIDSLKLVYPVKSVAVINVEKNDFDQMFNFCFESLNSNQSKKNEQVTKLNDFKKETKRNLAHGKHIYSLAIASVAVLITIIIIIIKSGTTVEHSSNTAHKRVLQRSRISN